MQDELIAFALGEDQELSLFEGDAVRSLVVVKRPIRFGLVAPGEKLAPDLGNWFQRTGGVRGHRVVKQAGGRRLVPSGKGNGFRAGGEREIEKVAGDGGERGFEVFLLNGEA